MAVRVAGGYAGGRSQPVPVKGWFGFIVSDFVSEHV